MRQENTHRVFVELIETPPSFLTRQAFLLDKEAANISPRSLRFDALIWAQSTPGGGTVDAMDLGSVGVNSPYGSQRWLSSEAPFALAHRRICISLNGEVLSGQGKALAFLPKGQPHSKRPA